MKQRDVVLLAGAVAAGLQAASSKATNPFVTTLFIFLGVGLAYVANPPRDPETRERASDLAESSDRES